MKAGDSAGSNDAYDNFARNLEKFCGLLDDPRLDGDKSGNSRTDSWQCWDVPSNSHTSSHVHSSSGSFDTVSKLHLNLI